MAVLIEAMTADDWPDVCRIYEEGLATGTGSFETAAPSWEVAIYVAAAARGRGVGRVLLEELIESAEAHGIWTLQGATIAENVASLALQAMCGFRVVDRRERIAKRDNVWHDTILTERRSQKIGLS
jgi:L-amino acid N-acyltransferase YncA